MPFSGLLRDISGFHRIVWVLFFGNLVNAIGGFMIRPFLALYLYSRLGASTVVIGLFMGLMALVGLASGMVAGSFADRFGRRRMMIIGLAAEAAVMLLFSRARTLPQFVLLGALMGTVGPVFWPASSAAIADVTPPEKRAHAYGLLRIAVNVGAAIGPLIGAIFVTRSYSLAFLITAVSTTAFAVAVAALVPETKPAAVAADTDSAASAVEAGAGRGAPAEGGYRVVLRDSVFVVFLLLGVLVGISYAQIENTLAIFLTSSRGLTAEHYGSLIAFNGLLVVVLQLGITHLANRYPVQRVLALSALVYAVGYLGFGFMHSWFGLMAAMAVVTIGEMINAPSYTKFVADISPADLRGRYMAASGLPWGVAGVVGPILGGFLLGRWGGTSVWVMASAFCLLAAAGYTVVSRRVDRRAALAGVRVSAAARD
ncbi:MAG: MDR family MFS transporter [Symbiobacteriia bacterium]